MGFLDFIGAETRSATTNPADATTTGELMGWTSDADTAPLRPETALSISEVFAAVRLLADTLATTPVDVFRVTRNGARKPYSRPRWLDAPNPDTRRIKFLGQIMTSLVLQGNAYILITRSGANIVALDVIPTHAVEPVYVPLPRGGKQLVYQLSATGEDGRPEVVGALDAKRVLHIAGLPLAGQIRGVSPLDVARRIMGLSISAREYGAEFFDNGAAPGAVVRVPGTMTPAGLKAARATWRSIHGGKGNRHGLAILTEGAEFQKITTAPEEAQFLETRQFAVADVARFFGVPNHLIGDATGSTSWGSGLAEQNTAFVQYAIRAWAERLDEAFTTLLGEPGIKANAFVKFNLDGLQRGSKKDRYETYRTGLQNGILTRNEVRALEDLPPDVSGYGDFLMVPSNLALLTPDGPVSLAAKAPSPPVVPATAEPEAAGTSNESPGEDGEEPGVE